jgi:Aromatic-ring-opening dioxygenase LigAB, LigA subunit
MASDYWLSKLLIDLLQPENAAAYQADRDAVLGQYKLSPELRRAVIEDDVSALAARVNAYLLRFHFQRLGWSDADFIAALRKLKPAEAAHG